ncbi:hypothetical protein JNUCC1_01622 [Lentibacillus sp. JNUCC-1]|uniref:hypothetical protein n=1 Tax=Lentibacillus sp. JNUCC-1 TaxID=2654513 RepID=UPI0012E80A7A|nr:hypothetical protein [Lentibacillus sp. JNUCC-1]MUV37816.1 hypothetical protein [Lentibacillus sp. JNUCC-1]
MKKFFMSLLFFTLFISGCNEGNENNVKFNGESENWEGSYSANISGSSENGEYIFRYKNAREETIIKNLKIVINDGEITLNESEYKGGVLIYLHLVRGA